MQYAGREVTLDIKGKTYRLGRYDLSILSKATKWAAARLPDPLSDLEGRLDKFPPAVQELLVKEAIERKQHRQEYNSPEIQGQIKSPEGAVYVFYLLFNKYHPEITEEQVGQLYLDSVEEHNGPEYLLEKVGQTFGQLPKSDSEGEREALQAVGALPQDSFRK